MNTPHPILSYLLARKYRLALGSLLLAASLIAIVMERLHAWLNGSREYAGLIFNLGLAWVPFIAAALAYLTRKNRLTFYLVMPVCALVWLAFFPNAPYLLTDFNQLARSSGGAPLWLDVILLIWVAWTGLFLGIASLYLIQEIVTRVAGPLIGWAFALVATALSSVGVYLGRFLRWNSWDLLYNPLPIARDMYGIIRDPIDNLPTYVFTILFTLLFLFIYVAVHLMAAALQESRKKLL